MAKKTVAKKQTKSTRSRKRATKASRNESRKSQYSQMHEITGSREDVLQLMKDTIQRLGQDKPSTKKAGMRSLGIRSARQWTTERDQLIDTLKRGYDNEQPKAAARALGVTAVPNERAVDTWYAPRNRVVAVFQSAMDEYLDELDEKRAKKSRRGTSLTAQPPAKTTLADFYKPTAKERALRIIEQYSNLDPRWVEVVWAKAKLLFKGKRKFISHSSTTDFRFSMKDETTVAIVGDWGGGNAAAQAIAEQIRKIKPDHVIHLGDVYYAGTEKEVQDRFLRFWPTTSSGGQSFALNSNHEMYSGGYGYFNVTLKQFRQPASYFSLANKNWRFIGLDTGYVDHDLNKEQVDWLTAQFKGNNPKTILLTHHQLFSAYEKTDASNLQSRVQPLLDTGKIYGWIWGHEHLCVVYQKHMGINAVCLGNGCFPYNAPTSPPKVAVAWINSRPQGDGDFKGVHTFALLKIAGPTIDVQYIDQDGFAGFQQTWT
jgi:predicted phosphodiesterase